MKAGVLNHSVKAQPKRGVVEQVALANRDRGKRQGVGASLYFVARLIYLPLYAAGVPKLRTMVFGVSLVGLILCWWALMFA